MQKGDCVLIHHRNLQALATEMYKTTNNMFPTIANDIFLPRATPYNPRYPVSLKMQKGQSVYNSIQTLSHLE